MTIPGSKRATRHDLVRQVGMSGNYWYVVEQEKHLPRGQATEVTFWKTSIALYRGQDGIVRALENRCAHRHLRLSEGQVEENALTCAYHGWTYNGDGKCVRISHELGKARSTMPDICLRSYPVRCKYGLIWLFPGNPALADSVPLPSFPVLDGPRPWPFVPIDMTIQAHFSMVVENVCDFNHAYLHRKYKPFWNPHARAMWRDDDTIYIDYDTHLGQGQAARVASEDTGKHLNFIRIWYQYPYQGSDLQGKYFHWLYMLPIDEQTTRCFFYFVFGPMEIPYVRLNVPFVLRNRKSSLLLNRRSRSIVLSAACPCSRAPDLAGGLHYQLELAPLFVLRQQVTGGGRRKAALGAQGQVLDRDIARRLVDAVQQLVLGF